MDTVEFEISAMLLLLFGCSAISQCCDTVGCGIIFPTSLRAVEIMIDFSNLQQHQL